MSVHSIDVCRLAAAIAFSSSFARRGGFAAGAAGARAAQLPFRRRTNGRNKARGLFIVCRYRMGGRQVCRALAICLILWAVRQHVVVARRHQLAVDVPGAAWLHELCSDVLERQLFIWIEGKEAEHAAGQAFGVGSVGHGWMSSPRCQPY